MDSHISRRWRRQPSLPAHLRRWVSAVLLVLSPRANMDWKGLFGGRSMMLGVWGATCQWFCEEGDKMPLARCNDHGPRNALYCFVLICLVWSISFPFAGMNQQCNLTYIYTHTYMRIYPTPLFLFLYQIKKKERKKEKGRERDSFFLEGGRGEWDLR